jgi:hypothetical protein
LQACCAAMTGTLATACQSAATSAAGDDATCALVVQGFQQQGYCK